MKPSLVTGGVVCGVLALLGVLFAVDGGQHLSGHPAPAKVPRTEAAANVARTKAPAQGARSESTSAPQADPVAVLRFAGARQLAADINHAQEVIDDPASPSGDLADAGLLEQLATGSVARETPRARHATLSLLRPEAAATMRTDLAAGNALSRLTVATKQFPPWRIAQPLPPGILLNYFREAQSRFGVAWEYLAAIEFIETRFGRVHGPSSAGAQGPMQFLPATWSRYGAGNIDNQRDAINAAARYLVANGAPADMATALYHYNPSADYVAAVQDYAGRIRADPRAYDGYYNWQVLYARVGGLFRLPVGYPRLRPVPVHYP